MEEESWGVLTKLKFNQLLDQFTKRFSKPIRSKRLAISFWDHNRNEVDTRIRITDGNAEIMQKIGDIGESKHRMRSEQKVNLPPDSEEIFNTYKILRVLIPGDNSCYIYQYDNFVFEQPDFEIKLTQQSAKTDKYNFEVEVYGKKSKLNMILTNLGLSNMVTTTDAKFWDKWNDELNLKDTDLKDEQIKWLISTYLTSEIPPS